MGFRFRKLLKITPGVWLNLSKSGTSLSVGGKGLTFNIGKKGTRATVGLPGSGLSYSTYEPHAEPGTTKGKNGRNLILWAMVIAGLVALAVFAH